MYIKTLTRLAALLWQQGFAATCSFFLGLSGFGVLLGSDFGDMLENMLPLGMWKLELGLGAYSEEFC